MLTLKSVQTGFSSFRLGRIDWRPSTSYLSAAGFANEVTPTSDVTAVKFFPVFFVLEPPLDQCDFSCFSDWEINKKIVFHWPTMSRNWSPKCQRPATNIQSNFRP